MADKALSFVTDDYVDLGTTLSYANTFSIECWIYPTSSCYGNILSNWANVALKGFVFMLWNATDTLTFVTDGNSVIHSSSAVTLNAWNHVVVTFDGSTNVKFYIAGAGAGTGTMASASTVGVVNAMVGVQGDLGDNFFNGYIDELRFYNKVLSDAEVLSRYNAGAGWYGTLPDANLIAGYHFDNDFFDYSGSGYTGTNHGATFVAGKVLKDAALQFDGNDDYVDLGNPSTLQITGIFSLEFWFKTNSPSGYQSIFSKSGYFFFGLYDGRIFAQYAGGYTDLGNVVSDNDWHHAVFTYDGTNTRTYLDSSIGQTKNIGSPGGDQSENAHIGAGVAVAIDGCVDETRVYNGKALSQAEINARYNAGVGLYGTIPDANLVAGYHFDDDAIDYSGNGNNGTVYGATYVAGKVIRPTITGWLHKFLGVLTPTKVFGSLYTKVMGV